MEETTFAIVREPSKNPLAEIAALSGWIGVVQCLLIELVLLAMWFIL